MFVFTEGEIDVSKFSKDVFKDLLKTTSESIDEEERRKKDAKHLYTGTSEAVVNFKNMINLLSDSSNSFDEIANTIAEVDKLKVVLEKFKKKLEELKS